MYDAVQPPARGFAYGGGQLGEFVFFCREEVEADGKRFGRTGGNDFVVHFFHAFLAARHQDDGRAFGRAVFRHFRAYALRGSGYQDGSAA